MVGVINPVGKPSMVGDSGTDSKQNSSVSLAKQKQDASEAQYMLAPGQPFPSKDGVPQGDIDPIGANHSTTAIGTATGTSTSSAVYGATSYSHGLSEGAIAGIAIAGVVGVLLFGALLFLLGRHKTMLQFMKRGQYQQPGPQNPSGDQSMRSHHHHSASPSAMQYSEAPNSNDLSSDSPLYSEHPAHAAPMMADLPSPGEKSQERFGMEKQFRDGSSSEILNPAATQQPQQGPMSCLEKARLSNAQYVRFHDISEEVRLILC